MNSEEQEKNNLGEESFQSISKISDIINVNVFLSIRSIRLFPTWE